MKRGNNFVTYKQALILKELGFNREVLYYFVGDTFVGPDEDHFIPSDWNSNRGITTSAPTLDEAQRWLIDKKGLCICPGPEAEYVPNSEKLNDNRFVHTGWTYNILIITEEEDLRPGPWCPKGIVFSSYNEALSDGINVCFKLLKGEDDLGQYGVSVGENKFHTVPFKSHS